MPDIVLIADGSPDPRQVDEIETLADAVRDRVRSGTAVGACYLEHHMPGPMELAADLSGRAVAVPLLLTPAARARVDVPRAVRGLRSGGARVRLAPTLGPDERLLDACAELLAADGERPDRSTAVVLFAADPPDGAALAAIADTIARSPRPGWGAWDVAAIDGVEAVVRRLSRRFRRIIAVSFMITAGTLRDGMLERCTRLGVRMVPGVLAETSALADLVVARTLK